MAHLQRARYDILECLDQLFLCNLRLHVDLETTVNVTLGGLHPEHAPLIGPHHLALIRNRNLGRDHNRELLSDEFPHGTREGCVWHFL